MSWVQENWAEFEQVAMADSRAGAEKEFPAKSVSEPRQSVKNKWGVCWTRRSSGNQDWSWAKERSEWQTKKLNESWWVN